MRPQSAESLRYEEVRFRDIPALFTSLRVSKENMPEGIYRYYHWNPKKDDDDEGTDNDAE